MTVVIAGRLVAVFGTGLRILLWLRIPSTMDKFTIRSVEITQRLAQRTLDAGNVALSRAGDAAELVTKGPPNPGETREPIQGRSEAGGAA